LETAVLFDENRTACDLSRSGRGTGPIKIRYTKEGPVRAETKELLGITCPLGQELRSFGQATKGVRRMPWHRKPMKDVVSCDKRRRSANNFRPGDFRMG
jgi:hypothetical protein